MNAVSRAGAFVKFYITAHDTAGIVTLHRDSVPAAIKKAFELISGGCLNVEIVLLDGTAYDPSEFEQLKQRIELWPKRQPAEATLSQGGQ